MNSTINNLTVTATNLQSTESKIRDVDIAKETTRVLKESDSDAGWYSATGPGEGTLSERSSTTGTRVLKWSFGVLLPEGLPSGG